MSLGSDIKNNGCSITISQYTIYSYKMNTNAIKKELRVKENRVEYCKSIVLVVSSLFISEYTSRINNAYSKIHL